MKPEQAEQFLIQELFDKSMQKLSLEVKLNDIDKLTGDASTRRYYRLFTSNKSYVVCLDNPFNNPEEQHPFLSVQRYLEKNKIRVPRIIDASLTKGYLLEEDLGDTTILQHLSTIESEEEEYEIYKKIIDQLLVLHHMEVGQNDSNDIFKLKFDFEKYMDEMKFTIKYFIKIFLKNDCPRLEEALMSELEPLCQRLATKKMVITHRDFHSRNIMVKDNEFVVIDFQDARKGIPQYDLVSLLEDCYYDITENNRQKLKKYYFSSANFLKTDQKNFEEFDLYYRDMLIQRVFKAIGSFSYIFNWRKDERYLKYIGFAMEKIRKTMMHDERYSRLRKELFKSYYAT